MIQASRYKVRGILITGVLGISAVLLSGLPGCKTAGTDPDSLPFPVGDETSKIEKRWTRKMQGLITDLDISAQGNGILVAMIPDPDASDEDSQHALAWVNHDGKTQWSLKLGSPVKAQSLSVDGSFLVHSNYDNELIAVNAQGKQIWKAENDCRPFVLSAVKKVLCYHDDDAHPLVAYDVYDWEGNKVLSYPSKRDALVLKIAPDESAFAVAFTQGLAILFDAGFTATWQKKVEGEIIDIAVSSLPQVAVLSSSRTKGQLISIFDAKGKLLASGAPTMGLQQLEISHDSQSVFGYGNGPKGQVLAMFRREEGGGKKLKENWRWMDARYADYSSTLSLGKSYAIIGFENATAQTRRHFILGFDFTGKLRWHVPVATDESAYLYTQSFSEAAGLLTLGMDDAQLSAFQVIHR